VALASLRSRSSLDSQGKRVDAAEGASVLLDGADVEGVNAGAHEYVFYD